MNAELLIGGYIDGARTAGDSQRPTASVGGSRRGRVARPKELQSSRSDTITKYSALYAHSVFLRWLSPAGKGIIIMLLTNVTLCAILRLQM